MASMQRAEVCQPKFSARANLVNSLITGRGTRSHANATWPKTRRWCMHPIARRVNSVLMHRVPYPAEYLSIAGEGGEANDPQPDEKFPPVRIFAQDAARILHHRLPLSDFMMQLSRGLNDEITEFMRFSKILISDFVCLDFLCFVNAKVRIWYSKFLKYSTISIYALKFESF